MRQDSVIDAAAMTGQLVVVQLVAKLMDKKIISSSDAAEVFDEALIALEEFQGSYPDHREGFEKARKHLNDAVADLRKTLSRGAASRRRPPSLYDRRPKR